MNKVIPVSVTELSWKLDITDYIHPRRRGIWINNHWYLKIRAFKIPYSFPLPLMDIFMDSPDHVGVVSTLHSISWHWEVEVCEHYWHKISFAPHRRYLLICMPVEPKGASDVAILYWCNSEDWTGKCVVNFLENIFTYSKSAMKPDQHVGGALSLLPDAGITPK